MLGHVTNGLTVDPAGFPIEGRIDSAASVAWIPNSIETERSTMAPVADNTQAHAGSAPAKGAKYSTKEIIDLEHNYSA